MPAYSKIKTTLTHDEQVLHLLLNAPKGNILDQAMMEELISAIEEHGSHVGVKALLFEGAGDHFSFGASVPEHVRERVAGMLTTFHDLFRALIKLSKPCLAVVRGQCLGGGLELAAFCHWVFAAENAKFGQPEINLAVFPPVAALLFPYKIGQAAADDLVLSGRIIGAQEAKEIGLVQAVAADPRAELEKFLAAHILPKSGAALQFAIKASRFAMHREFLQSIDEVQNLYVQELMATHDANEGINAFIEKRAPKWSDGSVE